ncbi:MAG: hypothetical protein AAGA28_10790 [Pseudomonadota bacterium]
MTKRGPANTGPAGTQQVASRTSHKSREDRLKAALKANLARRKQQARGKHDQAAAGDVGSETKDG